MRIGIIGAENSHTAHIAKTINIAKLIPGAEVVCVWGETKKFAKAAAETGQIPTIVNRPEDMIGKVDGVMVDHRHGKYHLPAVRALLEAKLPLFVDKPFCYRTAEGKAFLARANELGVPVCSFSVLPKQASFVAAKEAIAKLGRILSVVTTGPCDLKSKYGGVFFYGIHQVDMILRVVGYDVTHAQINRGKANHTATLFYANGTIATMNLLGEGHPGFHLSVVGEAGRFDGAMTMDANPYLGGAQTFAHMFQTGETDETAETMLMPVAVLEALEKSIALKGRVKVARIAG
ncbi:MAG: Gfo/Idh/MocA family oxidoreductase [Candidatus Latescibacterota bacterium]